MTAPRPSRPSKSRPTRAALVAKFRQASALLREITASGLQLYVDASGLHLMTGPSHDDTPAARPLHHHSIEFEPVPGLSGGDW